MYKVIVAITTYNLSEYISYALDSVLNQETTFDYKVVVADDASTDGTADILMDYKSRYPQKLEVILNKKNRGSLANSNSILDKIECEYFSFLDGDDVWFNKHRMQMQVDFLDSHPEFSMCGGNTRYLIDGREGGLVIQDEWCGKGYSIDDLFEDKMPFIHTSAIMLRNSIFRYGLPEVYFSSETTFENCALRGEDFRRYLHLENGPIYIFNDVFSYYRIHNKGLWQGASKIKQDLETVISYNFFRKYWINKFEEDQSDNSYKGFYYFHNKFNVSYQLFIKRLIQEMKIFPTYKMNREETYLFTSLLVDLSKFEGER